MYTQKLFPNETKVRLQLDAANRLFSSSCERWALELFLKKSVEDLRIIPEKSVE